MFDDYLEIPLALRRAVKRGKHKIVVEFYHHSVDDIFSNPERAMFRYATTDLSWQNCKYKGKLDSTPTFDKFINKQFNSLSISLLNVKTGKDRPSFIVLNTVIKGFRVNVRCIAKDLPVADSWSVWSGRLDSVTELTKEIVSINCTQELGKFSYQLATDQYGSACPLRFGRGDCLGSKTLAEHSPAYQQAFRAYGHGGCNHTFERCDQLLNSENYQGQRKLTTGGSFNRIEYVKKRNWWTLGLTKKTKKILVPIQWSPKSQDDNSSVTIPLGYGRISAPSRTFTSADVGSELIGLVGFIRPSEFGIEGFYAVQSADSKFPVTSFTQHLGTLGNVGTQIPDPRFLASGFNSRLAYLGVTCADNSEDATSETANEFPTISAVIKASLVPVFDGNKFDIIWTHNNVWITRHLMINFKYTVIKPEWFNEFKNLASANLCYKIVEDDTNADIAVISSNEAENYNNGSLTRYHSSSRFNESKIITDSNQLLNRSSLANEPSNLLLPSEIDTGDIDFFPVFQNSGNTLRKTFLQFQFTLNGMINEASSLSDVLYGLVFPTYRGYMSFDRRAEMYIGMRQPAPSAFVREDFALSSSSELSRLPVTNVSKLYNKKGYLLIGAGQLNGEIRREQSVGYLHTPILVRSSTTNSLGMMTTNFQIQSGAPSRSVIQFSGTPELGSKIELSFEIPYIGQIEPHTLKWDWYLETNDLQAAALMFQARLQASPSFDEFWTCRVNQQDFTQLIIEYQAGYIILDRPMLKDHKAGEEIIRVVEVYENSKDPDNSDGQRDNIFDFSLAQGDDVYQSVKGTYISAIEDFTEVEILPYSAWATIEDEREMNLLELDLRMCDNYNQAAYLVKANYIDFVVGALYGTLEVPELAMFHQEDDVIAVRYQTLEGAVSYLPMWIMSLTKNEDSVTLKVKLYLSAMFDTRVPQEEKFLESTITPVPPDTIPMINVTGGYSSTRTGDGAGDSPQDINYKPKPYELLPARFHTDGSYSEVTEQVYNRRPKIFSIETPSTDFVGVRDREKPIQSFQADLSRNDFIPKPFITLADYEDVQGKQFLLHVEWDWVQYMDSAIEFDVNVVFSPKMTYTFQVKNSFALDAYLNKASSYRVRVRVLTANGYSEWSDGKILRTNYIAPIQDLVNYCLKSEGSTATATSVAFPATGFAEGAIDGTRHTNKAWDTPRQSCWRSGSIYNLGAQTWHVNFNQNRLINRINIFTLSDLVNYDQDPSFEETFTQYGIVDYVISYDDTETNSIMSLTKVFDNHFVARQFNFNPVNASGLYITVDSAVDGIARIVEVESYFIQRTKS